MDELQEAQGQFGAGFIKDLPPMLKSWDFVPQPTKDFVYLLAY